MSGTTCWQTHGGHGWFTHWPGIPAWSNVSAFLKFSFYAILSEFVLGGVEERAWGSAGYERFEDTSGDEAFGPLQVQYPVGACTPQELERSCQQTAHGAEYNLVCFNCNHFAARVLSRLGLSAWRRWLVLGLVASMVPLGYQVQVRLLSGCGAPSSRFCLVYLLFYWCPSAFARQCPAILQRFKVYEPIIVLERRIPSGHFHEFQQATVASQKKFTCSSFATGHCRR